MIFRVLNRKIFQIAHIPSIYSIVRVLALFVSDSMGGRVEDGDTPRALVYSNGQSVFYII